MKCPVCDVDLLMGERLTISIDYCPQCRGIWLEKGKLDQIIEKNETQGINTRQISHNQQGYAGHLSHDEDQYRKNKRKKSFFEEIFD